jgi:hypothetical protein
LQHPPVEDERREGKVVLSKGRKKKKEKTKWPFFFSLWDSVSLYSPGRPGTLGPPASDFWVLRLQLCNAMPSHETTFFKAYINFTKEVHLDISIHVYNVLWSDSPHHPSFFPPPPTGSHSSKSPLITFISLFFRSRFHM